MKKASKLLAIFIALLLAVGTLASCGKIGELIGFPNNQNQSCEHSGGAATCTEWGKCTECGKDYLEPKGHTEVIDNAVAATCTKTGLTEGKHCSVCSEIIVAQEIVEAFGHTEVIDKAVSATCEQTGLTEGKHCSECGETLVPQNIVSLSEHIYDNNSDDKCNICGKVRELLEPSVGLSYSLQNDDTYFVSGIGVCSDTDIVIPSMYNGKTVKGIDADAFRYNTDITSVVIPDTIKVIGNNAFGNCTNLSSVTIGKAVEGISDEASQNGIEPASEIGSKTAKSFGDPMLRNSSSAKSEENSDEKIIVGENAFEECSNLAAVHITDFLIWLKMYFSNDNSNPLNLAHNLFLNGELVTEINIPYGITAIPDRAFLNFHSLTKVIIPDSVISIGESVFYNCTSLASVSIPDGLTSIGIWAFNNCTSLTQITIPDSVTSIGEEAFDGCTGLQYNEYDNAYYLGNEDNPYTVLVKAKDIFISYLEVCAVHNDTKVIYSSAFEDCYHLAGITIPDGVVSIGNRAFKYCQYLTQITIPASVVSIGNQAFESCFSLTQITIPAGVTKIGSYTFSASGLTQITIPDSVTCIGEYAFYNCIDLTSVTIGSGVTSIGDYAFGICRSLQAVYITDMKAWCEIEFDDYGSNPLGCAKNLYLNGELVTELLIPDDLTSIGNYAFSGCASLTSVTIPDSVTSIGYGAFTSCTGLTTVTISDRVTTIYDYAFGYCTSLTSVTIPGSVIRIGYCAFENCTSLTTVTISDGVTTIYDYAFRYCTSLTSVKIPAGATHIGSEVFEGCTSLQYNEYDNAYYLGNDNNSYLWLIKAKDTSITSVTIPTGVEIIGEAAFENCTGLISITFEGTVGEWYFIKKSESWNANAPATEIVCLNGVVEIVIDGDSDDDGLGYGDTVINIWVSESEGVADITKTQIKHFLEANPEYKSLYTFEVSTANETNAAYDIVAGVIEAPDIYCFPHDMLSGLVQAGALAAPKEEIAESIRQNNSLASVNAASTNGSIYAYPMYTSNGYHMYYDKSIITNPDDLAQIVADCEAAGKNICFELENPFYAASFFMATGCISEWNVDDEGNFIGVNDTWNSDAGVAAIQGMQIVTKSKYYISASVEFENENAAVVITGIWNADRAESYFGDNMGATDLPSFTINGESYHLGSYCGYQLMGVKPQSDSQKAEVLQLLAQYLTSEKCQLERYDECGFIFMPSDLNALTDESIQSDPSASALLLQSTFATIQGKSPADLWDISRMLCAESKNVSTEEEIKALLNEYSDRVNALISSAGGSSGSQEDTWWVIGEVDGTLWSVDFPMTKVSDGVWQSDALTLNAGAQFKLRMNQSWETHFGANGEINGNDNIVVETSGTYIIQLQWDGVSQTANISLIPAS